MSSQDSEGESYVADYLADPKVYGDVEHCGWTTEEEEDYEAAAAVDAASPGRGVVVWMERRYPAWEKIAAASNSGPRDLFRPARGLTIINSLFASMSLTAPPNANTLK